MSACGFLLRVALWCNVSAGINIEAWLPRVRADQCRPGAEVSAPVGLGMSATCPRSSVSRRCFASCPVNSLGKTEAPSRVQAAMGSLSALRTVLVLGLVTALAGCAPGLNGTAERWEALYSRSLARIPGEKRGDSSRDGDYLLGIKRLRRLYCNVGIGFHIQVLPDGRITGVHSENRYSKWPLWFPTPCADPDAFWHIYFNFLTEVQREVEPLLNESTWFNLALI